MRLPPEDVNRIYPVKSVEFYGKGVIKVNRESLLSQGDTPPGGGKKPIRYLSAKSRSYLAFVVAATEVEFHSMLTLTYGDPYPVDGQVCKAQLNTLLTTLRNTTPDFSYLWVIEFQQRGALHYHILTNVNSPGKLQRESVAYKWARISSPSRWSSNTSEAINEAYIANTYKVHKHKKAWETLREADGAAKYMTKYALKAEQKVVPESFSNVGRYFGYSRNVVTSARQPVTMVLDTDALQLLLEVDGHQTKSWGVIPKHLFGVTLEPIEDV